MGLPNHSNGPGGSQEPLVVQHSPPRSGCIPLKFHQDSTHPYASSGGVLEDRSVLMGLPGHSSGPTGSQGPKVVQHSPPRSGCKPLKTRQDSTRPFASSVGVVEDRSVLMGLPDHSNGPGGSYGPLVVQHSPPRSGCKPLKTHQDYTHPYASSVSVVVDLLVTSQNHLRIGSYGNMG